MMNSSLAAGSVGLPSETSEDEFDMMDLDDVVQTIREERTTVPLPTEAADSGPLPDVPPLDLATIVLVVGT
jgi:hypothetical protein